MISTPDVGLDPTALRSRVARSTDRASPAPRTVFLNAYIKHIGLQPIMLKYSYQNIFLKICEGVRSILHYLFMK